MARRVAGHEFLRMRRDGGGTKKGRRRNDSQKKGHVENKGKCGKREKKMLGVGRTE